MVSLAFLVLTAAGGTGSMDIPAPPGDRYLLRTELVGGDAAPLRDPTRPSRPLLTFTQFTDIHLIDEESPLRTEFLDAMLGTAYRPQEGLSPQVLA
ncbi:MAG: hypothetical protein LH650_08265 [Chloroflexi bacterium]|nr:hypothetical protein [Chloroflexota bacterium]